MEKIGLNQLREMFLTFFENKGCLRHESFPLVPQGDSGLLIINSGMAPLKPYFTGEITPPRTRMTTCQKCIRTPDIERVGKTARHATFFEMLGNFSFGDYFKRDACTWALEFLNGVLGIPLDKLHMTVYLDDDEAYDIWTKELGIDPSHMVRLGKDDNFWEIGSGPCGPCSELYVDRGEQYGCGKPDCKAGCDCDRYVEVWNLVFTQFNSDGQDNYTPLEKKNIDTGMGLERLACIMQGVDSIFDVDTIRAIRDKACEVSGAVYGASAVTDVSIRVITDHIRSTTMMICDGILPSNEGRGYVLRRLLRRAARHGKLLGIEKQFLYELCNTVIEASGFAYPELREKQDYIRRVIKMEEESFDKTIDNGLKLLMDLVEKQKAAGVSLFPGADAFKLYDTFGFPVDLTLEILEENSLTLDRANFDALMNEQRERARAARADLGDMGWAGDDLGIAKDIHTEFTGYTSMSGEARVLAISTGGELRAATFEGEQVTVVLDKTPFYAEMGGQVADHGIIFSADVSVEIEDVQKTADGKFLHKGRVVKGQLKADAVVTAQIDVERRKAIMRAHSCTHLLHKALRNTLGTHVEQAGSLVEPDSIRFDFTHFSAITPEELQKVDAEVNDMILEGLEVSMVEKPIDEARAMGAMALFGEKYGSTVRVVTMGDYSMELCGGTHLDDTAKIGPYRTVSEFSVASGVRRIEARVGKAFIHDAGDRLEQVNRLAGVMKTTAAEIEHKAEQLVREGRELRAQLDRIKSKMLLEDTGRLISSAKQIGSLNVLTAVLEGTADDLRKTGDFLRDKDSAVVAVLACIIDDKITFHAACGKTAVAAGIKAGDLIKAVTSLTGGSGGGKPDSAMGGGKDIDKLPSALESVEAFVSSKL